MDKQSKPKVSQDVEVEITIYRSGAFKARTYTRSLLRASRSDRAQYDSPFLHGGCILHNDCEDDNDYWIVKPDRDNADHGAMVVDGMPIRLEHFLTQRNLHSHRIVAHVVRG